MSGADADPPTRRKLGSAYFLGFFVFALMVLLWMRGLGRLLIPVLLIGAALYGVSRVIRKVREPVD